MVLGVLGGAGDKEGVLWGTAWYYWVLMGTGLHCTVGYCMVLLGTNGYWVVQSCSVRYCG